MVEKNKGVDHIGNGYESDLMLKWKWGAYSPGPGNKNNYISVANIAGVQLEVGNINPDTGYTYSINRYYENGTRRQQVGLAQGFESRLEAQLAAEEWVQKFIEDATEELDKGFMARAKAQGKSREEL